MRRASLLVSAVLLACAAPRSPESPAQKQSESPPPPPSPQPPGVSEPAGDDHDGDATTPPGTAPPPAPPTASPTPKTAAPPGAKPPSTGDSGGGASPTLVSPSEIASAQHAFDEANKAFAASSDCSSLCKSLASMSNATKRLCDLVQGGSAADQKRCIDAKGKLEGAQAKVKASCGGVCGS